MHPRRLLPLLLAASLLVALAPSADAASLKQRKKACATRGDTVERSRLARVYEVGGDDHSLYGCLLSNGRRTLLASWFSCECSRGDQIAPSVWLAGRYVAIGALSCDPSDPSAACTGSLEVIGLSSRRMLHSAPGPVSDVFLRPNGALAYVSDGALTAHDAKGTRVLDSNPGVDLGSLATNGSLVYWMRDGAPQAAPFDG